MDCHNISMVFVLLALKSHVFSMLRTNLVKDAAIAGTVAIEAAVAYGALTSMLRKK